MKTAKQAPRTLTTRPDSPAPEPGFDPLAPVAWHFLDVADAYDGARTAARGSLGLPAYREQAFVHETLTHTQDVAVGMIVAETEGLEDVDLGRIIGTFHRPCAFIQDGRLFVAFPCDDDYLHGLPFKGDGPDGSPRPHLMNLIVVEADRVTDLRRVDCEPWLAVRGER